MQIDLTADQKKVAEAIVQFLDKGATYTTVGGYAGTGKTTVIAEAVKKLAGKKKRPKIAFCCFTGKASNVLREKLVRAEALGPDDYCGTIHGLIYVPIYKQGRVIGFKKADSIEQDAIVTDESSMIGAEIWKDLKSFGCPIVAVGDHGQLPPVLGTFNLMEKPDHVLQQIHRQAEGDPIIHLSMLARTEGRIPEGEHGDRAWKRSGTVADIVGKVKDLESTLFLCGFNATRVNINAMVRGRLGFKNADPMPGEKLVCLKNNHEERIFNGMTGRLKEFEIADPNWATVAVDMDGGVEYRGSCIRPQFGASQTLRELKGFDPRELRDLFDWGYCLTVHKAQGSEADNVVLFEQRFPKCDDDFWRRWLYTGVTRARKKLLIVSEAGRRA